VKDARMFKHLPVSPQFLAVAAAALAHLSVPSAFSASPDPVRGEHGMVVSASPRASEAAVAVLRQGGNAFDAAAALGFVLAVTWPEAGNLGGGGFMVAVDADGTATTLDFREQAPAAASADMYLDETGELIPGDSLWTARASGVPGSVDGLLRLWRDHGSGVISREALVDPAIAFAEAGFPIAADLANALNDKRDRFAPHPASAAIFIRRDGEPWRAGDILIQQDLAATLRRIADDGREGFYAGPTAERIAFHQATTGGLITREDLLHYQSVYREPVRGTFRGYEIVSMGPPSSGGVLLIQMLNMLDTFEPDTLGWGSSAYAHLLTEVQRRTYADRAKHLGDAEYWDVPVAGLTDPAYAARRARGIRLDAATPSHEVGAGNPDLTESDETTHYSIVDRDGNAVAITTTLNASFGSGIVVEGAGFLLNNEMDDFAAKPGEPNLYGLVGSEANAIAPGKRPLSSMTPTIALRHGKPALVLGSPGGSTIITTVLQVFLNVALHGMDIQEAVNAPRHHSQWLPDEIAYEPRAFPADVRANLEARGHTLADAPRTIGAANCIGIAEDALLGAPDPRRQSAAAGY